jgi:predicted MFS family arabinose efflux permease
VALLYGFFVIESRTETPLLPLRIITDFSRGLLYLASLLANAAQLSMFLFITYYFQSVLGYSAIKTRLAFLPFALAIIVAAVLSARPIANFGPLPVMLVGAALSVAALLAFSGISTDTSYVLGLMLPEILIAVGVGLSLFPLNNIVLQGIDPGDSGVAGALVSTTQQTGGSIGTALLNTIFTVSWPRRCRPSMDTAQCSSWRRRCLPAPLC